MSEVKTFLTNLVVKVFFNLLELNPVKRNYNIKYGGVILSNQVNIINGIEDCDTFIGGLTESYKDASGVEHAGEDKKQAYRRFPFVLHVDENYIEVKTNILNNNIENDDYENKIKEYYDKHPEEFEELTDINNNIDDISPVNVDELDENVEHPESYYQTDKVIKVNISEINGCFAYDAWDELAMRIMEPVIKLHKEYMDSQ